MQPNVEIYDWNQISDQFKNADILLGNGFSINLDSSFTYTSLFETFISSLPPEKASLYKKLGINNFEVILSDFDKVLNINSLFEIETTKIIDASDETKNGLIDAITSNHPNKDQIHRIKMENIGKVLGKFNKVFTLNYDILLYHTILQMNDFYATCGESKQFSDFFWGGNHSEFRTFEHPQKYPNRISVYYLHGAIFIFKDEFSAKKIVVTEEGSELLEEVKSTIKKGEIPLFISAGSADEKHRMIRQNDYLLQCLVDFTHSTSNLVIYGASLQSQDNHIVHAINKYPVRKLAIGIYKDNKSDDVIKEEIAHYNKIFKMHEILFYFDSTSLF